MSVAARRLPDLSEFGKNVERMAAAAFGAQLPRGDQRRLGHGPSPEWYWSPSRKAWRYLPRRGRRP